MDEPSGVNWLGSGRWAAALALGLAAAVDLAYGREASLVVTLVFAPFVSSALNPPRDTAVFAVAAVLLAIALGVPDNTFGTTAQLVRVGAVAVGGALAVRLSGERVRREVQLQAVRRVAETAQETILRPLPDTLGPLRLAARYVSAAAESSVGGDFYEAVVTPFGVRLIVGDVRGKGLDAVRLAASLLGEFRSRAVSDSDLREVVAAVDRAGAAAAESVEDFATAIFVEAHADCLRLIRCGHPEPIIVSNDDARYVDLPGTFPLCLGAEGDAAFTLKLDAGQRLMLYSDGAFEGRDASGQEFDLRASAARHARQPREAFIDAVLVEVGRHASGGIADDVVIVTVELITLTHDTALEGVDGIR